MNPYPSLHRLAIARLGAVSLLLHCLSAAVYPLIASLVYPRVGIVSDLSLGGDNAWAIGLHCFVVRQNVALGLLIQHVDIVVSQVNDPHPAARGINHHRGG